MTVNALNTKLLKSAIDCDGANGNSLLEWMHDNTTDFSNSVYSGYVTLFAEWKAAYEETPSNLYITTGSGTQQLTGIGSLPIPPNR